MAKSIYLMRHKVAFVLVAILLLFVVAMLPFAIGSIFQDIIDQSNVTYTVEKKATQDLSQNNIHAHVDIIGVNEWDGTAMLRISAYNNCLKNCTPKRIVFSSVLDTLKKTEDIPTANSVNIPLPMEVVTQNFSLPIFGDPIDYPFDQYDLGLGVEVEDLNANGNVVLENNKANENIDLAIQARVPRIVMARPQAIPPTKVEDTSLKNAYANVQLLSFNRPLYIRVLTVVLILLISVAAACAIFMRPLNEIVINSGALVLGVWGIRSILLGVTIPGITSVDLALSTIILFLLVGIAFRTFHFLDDKSGMKIFNKKLKIVKKKTRKFSR